MSSLQSGPTRIATASISSTIARPLASEARATMSNSQGFFSGRAPAIEVHSWIVQTPLSIGTFTMRHRGKRSVRKAKGRQFGTTGDFFTFRP
jgi:tRNA A37 threonylcarbamoyladenosine dehydratase